MFTSGSKADGNEVGSVVGVEVGQDVGIVEGR